MVRFLAHSVALVVLACLAGCETSAVGRPLPSVAAFAQPAQPKNEIPTVGPDLLDGFEGPEHTVWAFDSADDEGIGEYIEDGGVTQGKKALRVTLRHKGHSGKIMLRRDVDLDLSHSNALWIDVTVVPPPQKTDDKTPAPAPDENAEKPMSKFSIGLAFKSGPDEIYQESNRIQLRAGLNKDVRFALDEKVWKNAESKWQNNGPTVNLDKIRRVMILLFTDGEKSGSLTLDNLRVEGLPEAVSAVAPATAYRDWRPEILRVLGMPHAISQYQGLEIPVLFRASYRDIFDPGDVTCAMRVTAPSGRVFEVRGFFGGLYRFNESLDGAENAAAPPPLWGPFKPEKKEKPKDGAAPSPDEAQSNPGDAGVPAPGADEKPRGKGKGKKKKAKGPPSASVPEGEGDAVPVWMLRMTPHEIGRYTMQIYVRNSVGETRMAERSMVVLPQVRSPATPGRNGGNVRISPRDPRQFELQDGTPFYCFGQNVCWSQDWTPYIQKMQAYGANTLRIWLCPWGLNLELKNAPGNYDLKEAERIDKLVAQAESSGVRLIFCFTFHGATRDFWGDSAYNQVNGGPCSRPQDFFTDARAKTQFKRLLSYAASRWGPSPAILSWELMNEMDLASFDDPGDIANWSREMARHLKGADVHGHLVTTSLSGTHFPSDLFWDSAIDFVSIHGYGTDVSNVVHRSLAPYRAMNKPILLAEFGGGAGAADDIPDQDGARMQAGLWLTACSPACGSALPWWWDTYIEARHLYPVLESARRFVANEDRRGRYGEWVRKPFENGLEATGIMDSQGARLYVHRPDWTRRPEARGKDVIDQAVALELNGMIDGLFHIEFWDAPSGKVYLSQDVAAKEGRLNVQIPVHPAETGIKIDRKERLMPGIK